MTTLALLVALVISRLSFGQQTEKADAAVPKPAADPAAETKTSVPADAVPKSAEKLTLQETIDQLKGQGKTDEATFLTQQLQRVERYTKNTQVEDWGVIFGRLVVAKSDDPRLCDAQMAIHTSGWFVTDLNDIQKPVEFRMWGYHPAQVMHGGASRTTVNVGDVVLKPFLFDELATVRAELLFEGKVYPKTVAISVIMEHPPVNTLSYGTDGFIPRPDKEWIVVGPDLRIQRSGLTPIPHYFTIKAPGHLPFRREFELQPKGTVDLGVLSIAASPAFEIEFATASGLDFSKAVRRKQTVYAGDLFETNPGGKEWVEAGTLKIHEKARVYSFHGGLASLIVTDLGEGTLDDHLQPFHRERQRGQVVEAPPIVDGHVYLITHAMKKMWKHSTLMRVKIPAKEATAKTE